MWQYNYVHTHHPQLKWPACYIISPNIYCDVRIITYNNVIPLITVIYANGLAIMVFNKPRTYT